ncbi:hypothetical protein CF326_g9551 [Tilletia indica]|nr:hypothetical protein CF326_g9551 [Tilletia indica]
MSSTPIILSLVPVRDPEDAQSLAFTPADGLALFLGGTHRVSAYSKRPSFRAIDFTFDQQLLPPDHARISISGGNVSITALQDDDTVRVDGTSLVSKGWLPLRHQDRIELSYYEPYDDLINHVVTLDVHISSHPHTAPSLSTPSILHAFHALQVEALRLAEEVKMARKQLQDVRDAAEAHVCVSTPPPRSYGSLLEDLRANAVGENFSGAETASLAATSLVKFINIAPCFASLSQRSFIAFYLMSLVIICFGVLYLNITSAPESFDNLGTDFGTKVEVSPEVAARPHSNLFTAGKTQRRDSLGGFSFSASSRFPIPAPIIVTGRFSDKRVPANGDFNTSSTLDFGRTES